MIVSINNYIQLRLQAENLAEIPLVKAAKWLDEADILKDSSSSPGFPLRRHVKRGNVFGVYKKGMKSWYIKRIGDYEEVLSVQDVSKIFRLKSRTSLYRKIRNNNIPFTRLHRKGIYFRSSDLMRWAVEKNKYQFIKNIEEGIAELKL